MKAGFLVAAVTILAASPSAAGVCNYRPSKVIGGTAAGAVAGAAGSASAAGATLKAIGVYTLVNPVTNATMIGGTWAGASAAGTAGIIAGSGGMIGTITGIITAPATIFAFGAAAVATGGFEIACMLTDETIRDYKAIDEIVQKIAEHGGQNFVYLSGYYEEAHVRVMMSIVDGERVTETFKVKNMYIRNGELMHSDWGVDTSFGMIALLAPEVKKSAEEATTD